MQGFRIRGRILSISRSMMEIKEKRILLMEEEAIHPNI